MLVHDYEHYFVLIYDCNRIENRIRSSVEPVRSLVTNSSDQFRADSRFNSDRSFDRLEFSN